jgi:hypothetical protein
MFSKKPLICAGISAVLLVFLPMFFSMLGLIGWSNFFTILGNVSAMILSVYFIYGFYYLGLKYKNKLLSVVSCIAIIFSLILYLVLIFASGPITTHIEQLNQTISQQQSVLDNLNATNASVEEIAFIQTEMNNTIFDFFGPYLVVLLVVLFLWLVGSILFNVALIKLKKVEYAKATGVIGLVSIGLTLTIIGIFLAIPLMIAYYVMLVIILFSQAKKFKEIR